MLSKKVAKLRDECSFEINHCLPETDGFRVNKKDLPQGRSK